MMSNVLIRPACRLDFAPIKDLLEKYRGLYFDDYDDFDDAFLTDLLFSSDVVIIDNNGQAVGIVWYSHWKADLFVVLHMLVAPQYLKRLFQQHIFEAVLDWGFLKYGVGKIKAEAMATQKGAIKLLQRFRFIQSGRFKNETYQHGQSVDIVTFELHRADWLQQR